MNWKDYTNNRQNIDVEIGFGNSPTITSLSKEDSKTIFVGIEINSHFTEKAIRINKTENIHFINADVRIEIHNIPYEVIDNYYIYFPSPFPLEQRIFNNNFYKEIYRTLKKHGTVKVVTDHFEYFITIEQFFSNDKWNFVPWQRLPYIDDKSLYIVKTDCELEYGSKYYFECIKS